MKRFLVILALLGASGLQAQAVSGRVTDSTTALPVAGVTVTLTGGSQGGNPGAVVRQRTDDRGMFEIRAAGAGSFTLEFKQVGYYPRSVTIQLAAGRTETGVYAIRRLPTSLDTTRTNASTSIFSVTPGREIYRRHLLLDVGQLVSGVEIRSSKLSLMEYLGGLPGLRLMAAVAPSAPAASSALSPPAIPGKAGFLVSSSGNKCLYGRIDHWGIIGLLDLAGADDIEELITVDDIMGVELYGAGEVPPDWAGDARVDHLVWHMGRDGRDYLIGDLGMPRVPRVVIPPNRGNPEIAPHCYMPTGAEMNRRECSMPGSRTGVGQSQSGNSTAGMSFDIPHMPAPRCGFVQIWTRISW